MAKKYQYDPEAYKRRLKKEKQNPAFKERIKEWEQNIADQPEFDAEEEALKKAGEMTKAGDDCTIYQAPKELGGKWKVISWKDHDGMGPDSADMLGWCMIYDSQLIKMATGVDEIEEV